MGMDANLGGIALVIGVLFVLFVIIGAFLVFRTKTREDDVVSSQREDLRNTPR
jgi:hypothetical protein